LIFLLVLIVAGIATMIGTDSKKPRLAIDLDGGTSVTLTAKALPGPDGKPGAVTSDAMKQAVKIIRQRVNGFGVSEAQVTTLGNDNIVVAVPGDASSNVAEQVGQTALLRFRPVIQAGPASPAAAAGGGAGELPGVPGVPGQGRAVSDALLPADSPSPDPSASASASASADPTAKPSASAKPSAKTSASAKPSAAASTDDTNTPADQSTAAIPADVQAAYAAKDCSRADPTAIGDSAAATAYVVACDRDGYQKYLLGPSEVQGTQVSSADAALPSGASVGAWQIDLNFNGSGTSAFQKVTKRLAALQAPQNELAITLDGVVQSAPTVNEEIATGQAQITGTFTQDEASDLANVLKYGALPLAFTQSKVDTVSATLGSDQLHGGLIAGGIGLLLVVIYCLFFYRGLGVPALLGLTLAAFMSYMAISLLGKGIGYRLSIAGIAGTIVAIGITADSFVVFFERLRDEIRDGRTPRAAVEYGWKRAWRTIRTANFVSLLAAAVLYFFSVADVKGFAFTLGMATIIDVVVIFLFTKPVVTLLMRRPYFARGKKWSGVSPESLGLRRLSPLAGLGTTTVKEA
jgi:preprotein translocase subunit SecD